MTATTIAIITEQPGWHSDALHQAFSDQQLTVRNVSLAQCRLHIHNNEPGGAMLPGWEHPPCGVFVRSILGESLEQIILRMNILHALQTAGSLVYNSPRAIERSVDKPLTSLLLANAGIPTPPAWVLENNEQAIQICQQQADRGIRLVQKPLFGSQGNGVRLLAAGQIPGTDEQYGGVCYLQQYLEPPAGEWFDYRVLVIARRAVAAMRRHSKTWPTNRAQGGICEFQTLSPELAHLAERTTTVLDMDYAGVDIMPDNQGRLHVLEANSMPAWQGLQQVHKECIARLLVSDFIEKLS